jgi:hypothetical protein
MVLKKDLEDHFSSKLGRQLDNKEIDLIDWIYSKLEEEKSKPPI